MHLPTLDFREYYFSDCFFLGGGGGGAGREGSRRSSPKILSNHFGRNLKILNLQLDFCGSGFVSFTGMRKNI